MAGKARHRRNALQLQHEPLRIFQAFLDAHEEGHGFLAVDDAVIVAERQIHHRPDHDLAAAHHRALLDRCMPRMPDCGALRIGVDISEP